MRKILHVNASPRGEHSKSLAIAEEFLRAYQERHADLKLDTWNLFEEPLPEYSTAAAAAKMAAVSGQPLGPAEQEQWRLGRVVFDRFAEAEEYVFNVPMWNHGVPYVLKQWIDIITQPGWTFGFDPSRGYNGLVEGKRAVVVYTSGIYRAGNPPGFGSDFHSTYFDDWLRFIGVADIAQIYHSGNDSPYPDQARAALEKVQMQARTLAGAW